MGTDIIADFGYRLDITSYKATNYTQSKDSKYIYAVLFYFHSTFSLIIKRIIVELAMMRNVYA